MPASSVKAASRVSASAGSGSSLAFDTMMTPHSRPSTMIGTPTLDRMPSSRTISPPGPESWEKSSMRTDWPASQTSVAIFRPPRGVCTPGRLSPAAFQRAKIVTALSGSYRPTAA